MGTGRYAVKAHFSTVCPADKHVAGIDARGDARDLQLHWHVPLVQDAGSRLGASGFTAYTTKTAVKRVSTLR